MIRKSTESSWRWFPLGVVAAMLGVVAVNGSMIYAALHSFPGAAGEDGFDLSNNYDRVLAASARQAALGWRVRAGLDAVHHPILEVAVARGHALAATSVQASAERPVGPAETTKLSFHMLGQGRLAAGEPLPSGQWTLYVQVVSQGQTFSTTQRLIVP